MDFLKSFPYSEPREEQIRVLKHIENNWNKKYFLVDAPPGVGKSAIAMSIARSAGRSYFLTSTKLLQDQYQSAFSIMKTLKGKSNYTCDINNAFKTNAAPCISNKQLKASCIESSRCSYYNARDAALLSDHMITSYAYHLMSAECGPLKDRTDRSLRRNVVICDEAHELDSILADFLGFEIDKKTIKIKHGIDISDFYDDDPILNISDIFTTRIIPTLNEYDRQLELLVSKAIDECGGLASRVSSHYASQISEIVFKRDDLDRLSKRVQRVLDDRAGHMDDWLITKSDGKIIFSPLVGRVGFNDYISIFGEKIILMSASLGDPEQMMDELGIPSEETAFIRVGTPFDANKSPIYSVPMLKLSIRDIDRSIDTMIEAVETILDTHPDQKGIIHAGNYKITSAILNRVSKKHSWRLIGKEKNNVYRSSSNEDLLRVHRNNPKQTVLVSPSMHTGVDLVDDLSRFQIIVKLPWPNLTDPRVEKKSKTQKWYANEMIKKLIQSTGRSTRTIDDHCETYILDHGFNRVWDNWNHIMPEWFKERIIHETVGTDKKT